jgi:hypothetical protein
MSVGHWACSARRQTRRMKGDTVGNWRQNLFIAACRLRDGGTGELMSAIGPKRTSLAAPHMSAFGGKADMTFCAANVCY